MEIYNPEELEKKWQANWKKEKIYQAKDNAKNKENFMLLIEFPYPSGNLHIGHWYTYSVPDILARYLMMTGKNIIYPMGFDAFGLPAENAAIKRHMNPNDWTKQNIKYMTNQLKSMGAIIDWSRQVSTIDPKYYKWTQWIFLQMFEKGLVYRAKTNVNWCPNDKTVLANEQVVNGKCERCDTDVIQKEIEQWLFKITAYADKLIDDMETLDWPLATKLAQKNWIGRSEGAIIKFKIQGEKLENNDENFIEVFTTRPDTIFGATYLVLAPDHSLILKLESHILNLNEVTDYVQKTKKKTELERMSDNKEKTGVELKGIKAINPANNEELPIFISDYVLANYGTGAIMAVPAHDERDFAFAETHKLPINCVIEPEGLAVGYSNFDDIAKLQENERQLIIQGKKCYSKHGNIINSPWFNNLRSDLDKKNIIDIIEKKGIGKKKVQYKLRDWLISRQRYWGAPIPVIKCRSCGYVPVKEKDLPIKLPKLDDFLPTSDGQSPLAKAEKWVNVKCPKCNESAKRETDTMDTFVDSSWYFIRYCDTKNKNKFADSKKIKKWLPVPLYIGGAEHNTMHLLYSRFLTKALFDLKLIDFNEPFIKRRNHGVILGPDNQKMSKSRGNVVDPDKEVAQFGADCVRMYLAFMGPYELGGSWNPTGILGVRRFLDRVWKLANSKMQTEVTHDDKLEILKNKTIKKVTEDIESMKFHTSISTLMEFINAIEKGKPNLEYIKTLVHLLSPFAPFITEEIWRTVWKNKTSIFLESWPKYDKTKTEEATFKLVVQINGKTRGMINMPMEISEEDAKKIINENESIKKYLITEPKKIIFVKNRLINFVI